MKVTQEQYDTLTKSVEHWRRAVAGKLGEKESVGPEECACCRKYMLGISYEGSCTGCPIYQKTLVKGCRETPWEEIGKTMPEDYFGDGEAVMKWTRTDEFRELAKLELLFLESLLAECEVVP